MNSNDKVQSDRGHHRGSEKVLRKHREPLSLALRGGQGWLSWEPVAPISDNLQRGKGE